MGTMYEAISVGAIQKVIALAIKDGNCKTLVDILADLKSEKEEMSKVFDTEINKLETELTSRGLSQLEDKNVKFTTFKGDKASVTVGLTRSLKVLNVKSLRNIISKRWHGEILTKDPSYSVSADFSRALSSLYFDDYVSDTNLAKLLTKGLNIGDKAVTFSNDNLTLLLKKLKGDYEKDKLVFEGIPGTTLENEIDVELYFITKIKNWERILKYFSEEEAIQVKKDIKNGIFVSETVKLTMRQ